MKYIFKLFLLIFGVALLLPGAGALAAEVAAPTLTVQTVTTSGGVADLYLFYGEECPHCAKEKVFLAKLKSELGDKLQLHYYEVWHNQDNARLMSAVAARHNVTIPGVPLTVIGDEYIIGYRDDETTGAEIRTLINSCSAGALGECPAKDLLTQNPGQAGAEDKTAVGPITSGQPVTGGRPINIRLPFVGVVDARTFSLPALATVIGLLDGFNPCAMWILVFLISLLMGVPSIRRRWLIGGIFIVASGVLYFLFMTAWLQAFMFFGYLWYIRLAIGAFAIIFGYINLRDWWRTRNEELACKVMASEKRQKIFAKLREIVQKESLLLSLIGIVILAFAVNMVELACSAGFPAVFTSVLAYSGIPGWQKYLWMAVYIIFYMLDDLIVFIAAMLALKFTGAGGIKYERYSKLIGGVLILLLGLMLIFRPGWLAFG